MARIDIIRGRPTGHEAALVVASRGAKGATMDQCGVGGADVLTCCAPSNAIDGATGAMTAVCDFTGC